MTFFLQSHDDFDKAFRVEDDFHECEEISLASDVHGVPPYVGRCSRAEHDSIIAFFVRDNEFHLHCNGKTFLLPQGTSISRIQGEDNTVGLVIHLPDGNAIEIHNCRPFVTPTFEDDPTAFAEPEDFDITLFIQNVVNSDERRLHALWLWTGKGKSKGSGVFEFGEDLRKT